MAEDTYILEAAMLQNNGPRVKLNAFEGPRTNRVSEEFIAAGVHSY